MTVRHDHEPFEGIVVRRFPKSRTSGGDRKRDAAKLVEWEKAGACRGLYGQGGVQLQAIDKSRIRRTVELVLQFWGNVFGRLCRVIRQLGQGYGIRDAAIGLKELFPTKIVQGAVDEVIRGTHPGLFGRIQLKSLLQRPFERQVLHYGCRPERCGSNRSDWRGVHLRFKIPGSPAAEVE